MDPLPTSISSVFGLLATYLQERRRRNEAKRQATLEEYTEWLRRREHAGAVSLLESNRKLMLAVQHLLDTGHEELIERFDRLETMLTLVLGSTAEWGELVRSLDPSAGLSEQAIEILRWFDASGASMVFQANSMQGVSLVPNAGGDNYSPNDPRFFEDDLVTLVGVGLLIPGYGSDGSPKYTITRAAVNFVKSLPAPADDNREKP